MIYENILMKKENKIATIIINRPEVRNALDGQTVKEILHAFTSIERDQEIGIIIFTGAGEKAFAAGADINELVQMSSFDVFDFNSITEVFERIENSKKVTIAAINGYALGGGFELALACDIRIASENAKFGLPELNLGIIPGAGGTQRLTRAIGRSRALDLILTGEFMLAEEAKQLGLVSQVVSQEKLIDVAIEKAERILQKGPLAIQMAKLAVNRGYEVDISTGLLIESLAQGLLFKTKDKVEGTTAFLEKRKANFTGT